MARFPIVERRPGTDRQRWEHFAHASDIGVRGFGETKEAAFEQAALAAMGVMTDVTEVRPEELVEVACHAPDDELLLVDWLNAVVYEVATRKMLFGRFEVHFAGLRLHGKMWGEKIDVARHEPCVEIKGATCTEARVLEDAHGTWVAQCVVDV